MLLEDTVGEKIQYIHNRMMHMRSIETTRLTNDLKLTLGDVTTINLTMLSGGVQSNVIPAEAGLVYDCRCSLDLDRDEFEKEVESNQISNPINSICRLHYLHISGGSMVC